MSQHIRVETRDGVCCIRIDRAEKKNALDRAMYRALDEALSRADADPSVGCILFCGSPGAFSAGNDIADFVAFAGSDRPMGELMDFLHTLAGVGKPMIAAVDGWRSGSARRCSSTATSSTPRRVRSSDAVLRSRHRSGGGLESPRTLGDGPPARLRPSGDGRDLGRGEGARGRSRPLDRGRCGSRWRSGSAPPGAKPREAVRIGRDLLRATPDAVRERIALEADHFQERLRSPKRRRPSPRS